MIKRHFRNHIRKRRSLSEVINSLQNETFITSGIKVHLGIIPPKRIISKKQGFYEIKKKILELRSYVYFKEGILAEKEKLNKWGRDDDSSIIFYAMTENKDLLGTIRILLFNEFQASGGQLKDFFQIDEGVIPIAKELQRKYPQSEMAQIGRFAVHPKNRMSPQRLSLGKKLASMAFLYASELGLLTFAEIPPGTLRTLSPEGFRHGGYQGHCRHHPSHNIILAYKPPLSFLALWRDRLRYYWLLPFYRRLKRPRLSKEANK